MITIIAHYVERFFYFIELKRAEAEVDRAGVALVKACKKHNIKY